MNDIEAAVFESELVEEIIDYSRSIARKEGISINPDEIKVRSIAKGLVKNLKKYGRYYCPCRVVTGDIELDISNDCPCDRMLKEVWKDGQCHCGLYVKV